MTFRWQQLTPPADTTATDAPSTLFEPDRLVERRVGVGEFAGMEFLLVRAKSIVNRVPRASRMPFEFTINPYRGCSHACTYCFARPTHTYLDLDPHDGFDRRIVVKINAAERARAELSKPSWTREPIAFGTNTDPYQRCEGKFHLMRGLLRALIDCRTPFTVLTKSTLLLRDLDLFTEAASRMPIGVSLSIPTLDPDVWRLTEPGTPHPQRRLEAVARLNDAGIACGILMAPILPGLSDSESQLRAVVEAGLDAGATRIAASPLYLHPIVRAHYLAKLREERPLLAAATDALFGDRTSQPPRVGQELSARINSLVDDGLRRRRRPRLVATDALPPRVRRSAPEPDAGQLSLLDALGSAS